MADCNECVLFRKSGAFVCFVWLFDTLRASAICDVFFIFFQMPRKEADTGLPDHSLENVDIEARIKTIEGLLHRTIIEEDRGTLVNVVEERCQ